MFNKELWYKTTVVNKQNKHLKKYLRPYIHTSQYIDMIVSCLDKVSEKGYIKDINNIFQIFRRDKVGS